MTIDEAIEKYKRVADEYTFVHDIDGCLEVEQMVEWLRAARGAEKAGRYFTRDIRELKQKLEDSERENARLREERERMFQANVEKNGEILHLLKRNTYLRELVKDMWQFTVAACKKYPRLFDPPAQGGQMVQPNMLDSFEQRMRELGVDVR